MSSATAFWDALAPHHARIEDNYLDRRSIRQILPEIQAPVLVVGAGQGLIVAELKKRGCESDGVDLSPEMVRFAASRRGLKLVQADASALPFEAGKYATVIYATGVIDFMADEERIQAILREGRRVLRPAGKTFVAFYRIGPALLHLLERIGLVTDGMLWQRQTLAINLMPPSETVAWVAKRTGTGRLRAAGLLLRCWARSTLQEKKAGFDMQKVLRGMDEPRKLIESAPERLPYRGEAEIRGLFGRLGIEIKQLRTFTSCCIVQV